MPRFELHIAPIADRSGINPFTKEPVVFPGRPGKTQFWEIELVGSTIFQCSDDRGRVSRSQRTFDDEDQARVAYGSLITKRRRAGYVEEGPSRELELPKGTRPPGSTILVDEYFASGDERFLDELLHCSGALKLASLAERWYADERPFARKMLLAYVDDGCDRSEHKALAKRLFKLAEAKGDDEAMGHFMVAFDRLAGRTLTRIGARWNDATRQVEEIIGLRSDPLVPERLQKDERGKHKTSARFTRTTRRYLARRAFRYFRRLGRKDVARYGAAMRTTLPVYRDEHLSTPAALLDAWGLMHVLYGYSPVLVKGSRGLQVAEGSALSELRPAPYFAAAWECDFDELFAMLTKARSRTVRTWVLAMLRDKYQNELHELSFAGIRSLLANGDEDVQRLGAELLKSAAGLEMLPIGEWLDLLRIEQVDVLGLVCEAIKKNVTPARLTLEQCVELACAKAGPVASLGLQWARGKPIARQDELQMLMRLRRPACRRFGPRERAGFARSSRRRLSRCPKTSAICATRPSPTPAPRGSLASRASGSRRTFRCGSP